MGIQFPPIAFLYLLYFCIHILFCTLVRSFIKLKLKLKLTTLYFWRPEFRLIVASCYFEFWPTIYITMKSNYLQYIDCSSEISV